jgi:hypothetical protein
VNGRRRGENRKIDNRRKRKRRSVFGMLRNSLKK